MDVKNIQIHFIGDSSYDYTLTNADYLRLRFWIINKTEHQLGFQFTEPNGKTFYLVRYSIKYIEVL